jgi:predicted transcriptional regulator
VSTLEIHVGVDLVQEARAIKDALRRHEAGEAVHEAHITFESWEGLTQVLTSKRLEILRHLHRNPEISIRSLSKALNRDYKNVHQDVTTLISAGLIDDHDGLRAEYDSIEMKMAL